ncbi:MAG: outer membrane protein assembly factor BamD [Gammaproteobacteria bacterium]
MRLLLLKILFLACIAFTLPGCETLKSLGGDSDNSENEAEYKDWDADKFRSEAKKAMDEGHYKRAVELYEKLEGRYPFGEHAAQTQLDIAYAYYKNEDYEAAVAAADRFIKTYPRNPNVDYAYYLKGLVNFTRDVGFIDRFLPTDPAQRNPENAKEAYDNFAELVRRFPNSQYAPDAYQRMTWLRNNIAMYEVHVARFYLRREAYIAAANRAKRVIEQYERTPAVPYAMEILQQAYTQLGLTELAADVQQLYATNYPSGPPLPERHETGFIDSVWNFIGLDQ